MIRINGDLNGRNISGIYSTDAGSFKVKQIGMLFYVRYIKKSFLIRNSPWLCTLSGIGVMSCRGEQKHILLQMFLGITDPISVIEVFLLTIVSLKFIARQMLSAFFLILVSMGITIFVALVTFGATALSATWRDEGKVIEKMIKEILEH